MASGGNGEVESSAPEYSVILRNFESIVLRVEQGIPTLLNHFLSKKFIHNNEYQRLLLSNDSPHGKASTLLFYALQQIQFDSSNLKVFLRILHSSDFSDIVTMLHEDLKEVNTKYQILDAHYVLLVAAFRSNLAAVSSHLLKMNLITKEIQQNISFTIVEGEITPATVLVNYLLQSVLDDSKLFDVLLSFLSGWCKRDSIGSLLTKHSRQWPPSQHVLVKKRRSLSDSRALVGVERSLSLRDKPRVVLRRHSSSVLITKKQAPLLKGVPQTRSKCDEDVGIIAEKTLVAKIQDLEVQMEKRSSKAMRINHFRRLPEKLSVSELKNQLEKYQNKIHELAKKEESLNEAINKMKEKQVSLEMKNLELTNQLKSKQHDRASEEELELQIEVNKALIRDKDEIITRLQKDLAEVNRELGKTKFEVQLLEKDIEKAYEQKFSEWKKTEKEYNHKLMAKDAELMAKDAESMAKDAELMAKDAESMTKDAELMAKDAELMAKDAELMAKDAELKKMEKEYQDKLKKLEREYKEKIEVKKCQDEFNESDTCPEMMNWCILI